MHSLRWALPQVGDTKHTPARTLVISNTRIPANGSVGELEAVVAEDLWTAFLEPLNRGNPPQRRLRKKEGLSISAIIYENTI